MPIQVRTSSGWRPLRCDDDRWVSPDEQGAHTEARVTVAGDDDALGLLLAARDALKDRGAIDPGDASVQAVADHGRELGLRVRSDGLVEVSPRHRSTQPLVSIVVPAYRATWLRECLDSALAQTYEHLEIVIADDCPDDSVRDVIAQHPAADRFRVMDGPNHRVSDHADRSGRQTYLDVVAAAKGDYIKFINDDDVIDPDCVRRFAACLDARPNVTLVTSHRRLIDVNGTRLQDMVTTSRLFPTDVELHGRTAASAMIATGWNFLGEPTTAMFRAEDAARGNPDFLSVAGRRSPGNVDMHLWASLGLRGDFAFLADTLSAMRMHPGQMQNRPVGAERGRAALENLTAIATETPLFTADRELRHREMGDRPWWDSVFTTALGRTRNCADDQLGAALEDATRLGGTDVGCLTAVSAVASARGRHAAAWAMADRALEAQSPVHPAALWRVAQAHLREGSPARALAAIDALHATSPRSRVVHEAVAQVRQGVVPTG